jgi:hypothetical protein
MVGGRAQGGILAEDPTGDGSRSTLDEVARGHVSGMFRLITAVD